MLCVIFTVLLLSADIVRGFKITLVKNKVSPQILECLTIHKVIHTWEEADLHCKAQGAVLASPITTELLDAMRALIAINNTPYFIGTRSSDFSAPFTSLEGVLLDNMTPAVNQMIQQLDPRDGDCLSMDQHSIHVVPCCVRLPYLCYKAHIGKSNSTTIYSDLNTATQETRVNISPESTITDSYKNDNDKTGNSNITYGIDVRFGPDYPTLTNSQEDTMMFNLNYTVSDLPTVPDYVMEVAQDKPKIPCGTYDEEYKYYESTGSCYKIHRDWQVWDDASATCTRENGHLLVIDDDNEWQVIKEMHLEDLHAFVFVGVRDFTGKGDWKSVTGKRLDEIYNIWHYGHPTDIMMPCGVIYPSGLLDNLFCHVEKNFICEKELSSIS